MPKVSVNELDTLVIHNIKRAVEVASELNLSFSAKTATLNERAMVSEIPKYRNLKLGYATTAWCSILFVDLRGSTKRAERIGAAKTYVTMHALLPALAHIVTAEDGHIVGFRGDGLFACFGIDDHGENPKDLNTGEVVRAAARSGQTMIEAVDEVINPLLDRYINEGNLVVGAGVDADNVVFTRIGLLHAYEITAYSDAINKASKLCSGSGYVQMSDRAWEFFPKSPGGKVRNELVSNDAYKIVFPAAMLEQSSEAERQINQIIAMADS